MKLISTIEVEETDCDKVTGILMSNNIGYSVSKPNKKGIKSINILSDKLNQKQLEKLLNDALKRVYKKDRALKNFYTVLI